LLAYGDALVGVHQFCVCPSDFSFCNMDKQGSSAVQVVALTTRIQQLQTHLARHRKDNSTKRGLDNLYVRRRKVLDYMERKDFESYRRVVKSLGLAR
jgi:small subunit ribosomal protein S15